MDRQAQLRALLELEPTVRSWSVRLGRGDGKRRALVQRYLLTQAELYVGLVREVRRARLKDMEVILVVDEYAEKLESIWRPRLTTTSERRFRHDLLTTLAAWSHVDSTA
jgi:hypothetical protein